MSRIGTSRVFRALRPTCGLGRRQFSSSLAAAGSSIPASTTKFLLHYDYVDGILEKRAPFRDEHVSLAMHEVKNGRLEQAGAYADPIDGALFVFTCQNKAEVEAFVQNDPYYKNGLVPDYNIREWTVVAKK